MAPFLLFRRRMSAPIDRSDSYFIAVALALTAIGCGGMARRDPTDADTKRCGSAASPELVLHEVVVGDVHAPSPASLAADDEYLYVLMGDGTVQRVPKCGGSLEPVSDGAWAGSRLTVQGDYAYWFTHDGTDPATGSVIRRAHKSGSVAEDLVRTHADLAAFAVDDHSLYWVINGGPYFDEVPGSVQRMALADRSVTALADDLYASFGVAVDASHVYWNARGTLRGNDVVRDSGLVAEPKAGGEARLVVPCAETAPATFALFGGRVWAAIYDGSDPTSVIALGTDGSRPTLVIDQPNDVPAELAVDADGMYGLHVPEGRVTRTPRDGGTPIELAALEPEYYPVHSMVVDADYVYFGGRHQECVEMTAWGPGDTPPHCVSYRSESILLRVNK